MGIDPIQWVFMDFNRLSMRSDGGWCDSDTCVEVTAEVFALRRATPYRSFYGDNLCAIHGCCVRKTIRNACVLYVLWTKGVMVWGLMSIVRTMLRALSKRGRVMFDKVLFLVALACTAAPMLGAAVFIMTLAQ